MKILGEKSLSSKVERGLKILFAIILILDVITLGITSVSVFSELNSISIRENYLTRIILEIIISIIFLLTGIVALFIINGFIKIFNNLKKSKIFEKENVKNLSNISKSAIIIGTLYLICLIGVSILCAYFIEIDILSKFLLEILIFVFSIAFYILGIGIRILNSIYEKAIEYKSENDFTI